MEAKTPKTPLKPLKTPRQIKGAVFNVVRLKENLVFDSVTTYGNLKLALQDLELKAQYQGVAKAIRETGEFVSGPVRIFKSEIHRLTWKKGKVKK